MSIVWISLLFPHEKVNRKSSKNKPDETFGLLNGIAMCSAFRCRGVKHTANRAYRGVKGIEMAKTQGHKLPKRRKKKRRVEGRNQNRECEPSIPGRPSETLTFISYFPVYIRKQPHYHFV